MLSMNLVSSNFKPTTSDHETIIFHAQSFCIPRHPNPKPPKFMTKVKKYVKIHCEQESVKLICD